MDAKHQWPAGIELADEMIRSAEGCELTVYLDAYGNPTVGRGHKILPSEGYQAGETLSVAEVDALYRNDLSKAVAAAVAQYLGNHQGLNPVRRAVLIEMAFHGGAEGLRGHKRMKAAIIAKDFQAAAWEILDSDTYRRALKQGRHALGILRRLYRLAFQMGRGIMPPNLT